MDAMVEDPHALDCVECSVPLKPPIFQCDVGHLVCSLCRDKLEATRECHACGDATGSYRRCHDMERLVESIRVRCSYAAFGCALRPAYYDEESHRLVCEHAPCHCPGEACSFVGSTSGLLDHCSTAHRWSCITKVKPDDKEEFTISLKDGFNFLLANCSTRNIDQGVSGSIQCLLLLNVVRQPYARLISVHCIDPHAAASSGGQGVTSKGMLCKLYYFLISSICSFNNPLIHQWQSQHSTFRVICTDHSNGLPKPDDCFQAVVPNSVIEDHDKNGFEVRLHFTIQ